MKTIAFVPLRGGSQSIPMKNVEIMLGKPLAYWLLNACEECSDIDEIIVATDSVEIEVIVKSFKLKKLKIFRRSHQNATNTASTESVLLEYLNTETLCHDDIIVLGQATNPFTTHQDLSKALNLIKINKADSLLSVCRNKRFFWAENGKPLNYDYKNRPRRQDFAGCYVENGAFYINSVGNIINNKNRLSGKIEFYEMSEDSYFEIDEPSDWIIVEELLKKQNSNLFLNNSSNIKLFLTDVDGVLTDGSMYYSENGDELKRFSTYDGVALRQLREHGILTGFVTSENSKLVQRRAEKLKIDYLYMGVENKLKVVKELCQKLNIDLSEVSYIGDDTNCFELLSAVGFKACPANSISRIKKIPNIIQLNKTGGTGVLREYSEILFNNYKKLIAA